MKTIRTIENLNALRPQLDGHIGFVPTMGALHAGHLSLIALAKKHSDYVIASIFVNPTQFAPNEDFNSYPRQEEQDAEKLQAAGVDVLFLPTANDLYADGYNSNIETGKNALGLEADFRPTHFAGVANIVSRLFKTVKPDTAIFGEKDFQQLQVIREMVQRYDMGIQIIGAPIARDEYGLALSSRNVYLSAENLVVARKLNTILHEIANGGEIETGNAQLIDLGFEKIDYIEKRWNRVLGAAYLGKTRLIDNIAL